MTGILKKEVLNNIYKAHSVKNSLDPLPLYLYNINSALSVKKITAYLRSSECENEVGTLIAYAVTKENYIDSN